MSRGLTQNFAGRHALIVSDSDIEVLANALARMGVKSTRMLGAADRVRDVMGFLRRETDILIIDAEGNAAAEMAMSDHGVLAPVPLVGLIGGESPSRLKILMRLGATALIRKPIHGASIYPALFLAVNEHSRRFLLESQVAEFEHRRRGRRFVMKAVLHRMATTGQDDDTVYEDLRREAMAARVSIEDYCEGQCLATERFVICNAANSSMRQDAIHMRKVGDELA